MNERHELEAARLRLELARKALVATGYFAYDEIGDDIAPRIVELVGLIKKTRPLVDKAVLREVVQEVMNTPITGTSASGVFDVSKWTFATSYNVSATVFCPHCRNAITAGKCGCTRPDEPDQPHIAKGE